MASEYTSNYNLDLYTDADKPNLRDQYNAAMNKVDAALVEKDASLSTMNSNITTLANNVTTLNGRVDEYSSQVGQNTKDIQDLDTAMDAITGRMSAAEKSIGDNTSDIADAQSDITAAQSDITQLQGDFATVSAEVGEVSLKSLRKTQTNIDGNIAAQLVHNFSFPNETVQSMEYSNGYLYIASVVGSGENTPIRIRKVSTSGFGVENTYTPSFHGHANSMCIFNNTIYVAGITVDGVIDYSYIGAYNMASGTSRTIHLNTELYSAYFFAGIYCTILSGIDAYGNLQTYQLMGTKFTNTSSKNLMRTNIIVQDMVANNEHIFLLGGSRAYINDKASPNALLAYSHTGELQRSITLVQSETGNSTFANELEGLAINGNNVYAISSSGYLYNFNIDNMVTVSYNDTANMPKSEIVTIFNRADCPATYDSNLMTQLTCVPDFRMKNLSGIFGWAKMAGTTVPVTYDMDEQILYACNSVVWNPQNTTGPYSFTVTAAWKLASIDSSHYGFNNQYIFAGTEYNGSASTHYTSYPTWNDIKTAGFNNREYRIEKLFAVYNGSNAGFTL